MAPEEFWRQTPRTFIAVMEGRALAATRHFELALSQAWHTEAFAREKRLKPLAKYLSANRPKPAQRPSEMLATLREIQSRGAPMVFKKVSGGRKEGAWQD